MQSSTESKIIETLQEQKGELFYLQALSAALLRSMSLQQRAEALAEFDNEVRAARDVLLYSSTPEKTLEAFERHVKALNSLRVVHED